MSLARAVIFVYGRVQMVGYRYFSLRAAKLLQLTGWVANEADRSVSLTVEGAKEKIEELIEQLREGPPSAVVDDVTTEWLDYRGEFIEFTIEH